MSTQPELLQKQMQTLRTIDRALLNFKKLGQSKMTAATTLNRMAMLKEAYLLSRDLDAKLAAGTDETMKSSMPYFIENHFIQSEDRYQEALDYMAEALAKVTTLPENAEANISQANPMTSQPTTLLPRIQLPTFDGTFTEWESFRDRFTSMVIANKSLANVERLHFLLSSLTGDASRAVSHLPLTEGNFEVAWKIITSRYENKYRLISTHLDTLFSLPSVSSETPLDLRSLLDKINVSLQLLRNLNRPVDSWSDIIVHLGVKKLDRASRQAWEFSVDDTAEFPTYTEFVTFLNKRIRSLEAMPTLVREKSSDTEKTKPAKHRPILSHSTTTMKLTCPVCRQSHLIYQCAAFLAKSASERFQFIKQQKRCLNCFSSKHSALQCKSVHVCKECNRRHNTLLHFPGYQDATTAVSLTKSTASDTGVEISASLASETRNNAILLSTARVRVHSNQGRCVKVRALMDQGSTATLITERLAQSLCLKQTRQYTRITGIDEIQSHARYLAAVIITPNDSNEPAYSTTALILKSLTRYVPPRNHANHNWSHLADLNFADKDPMSSDPIDIIIGSDLYGQLLLDGLRKGSARTPTAQNTTLGWILSGPVSNDTTPTPIGIHHISVLEDLDQNLRRFWEVEDLSSPSVITPENQKCESHFKTTHSRAPNGRYVVRLPFKTEPPFDLGESRLGALKRLQSLERRIGRNQTVCDAYREFLSDYESLGHMQRAPPLPPFSADHYYIPHHAVFRESSATTRLRVVFHASCRTSTGKSLNDHLLTGPKLQQDLVAILIRWRQFQFVYAADIEKMYRQILVDPRDLSYQRILWRDSPLKSVEEFELLTVTYGTAPAPFLALRVLQQLGEDEGSKYPAAVSVLRDQAYIDDFLFGADSHDSVRRLRDQTVELLAKGGFLLRKWASNDSTLLSEINPENHGLATNKSLHIDEAISVLGLSWNPALDHFRFKLSAPTELTHTKRAILSTISKLFDPLGWIAPIIVAAKIFLQSLWSLRCDWDDVIPVEFLNEWHQFYAQLPDLENISIPRKISPKAICSQSLHGFSDASIKAYAAAIYSRSVFYDGTVWVSLIIAKTRVAPVKTLSVPRLELCAALLLARLLKFVSTALKTPSTESHCWTDSTVTLAWLSQPPARWKTFVANRVAKVHDLLPQAQWHHVPTDANPADCASRGMSVKQLTDYQLWWSGPRWLQQSPDFWPTTPPLRSEVPLEERCSAFPIMAVCVEPWELATRYSSWSKLLRVTSYILRFVKILRNRIKTQQDKELTRAKPLSPSSLSFLSPETLDQAKVFWLKRMQYDAFPDEMRALVASKPVPKSSTLLSLSPYLSSDGLIHAKGRLKHSQLTERAKTPIILRSHPLLTLIIADTHRKLLHAGPSLTLAYLRNEFWILRARATVRNVLYSCVACSREKAIVPHELMGDLPAPRVTRVERPFTHTGVDYAGPIQVRTTSGRGYKSRKAYIAVFVCLTVKALHIELVSDYTSTAFLASYHRFVSRRGLPKSMYSDNGTTFQGANRELCTAFRSAIKAADFANLLASDGVDWHFLPPTAPHFGGLWEAAVKGVKYHLKRSVGAHTLTFEEMTTFLCRVEACLNSRPLGAVSECLDDYRILTPGHFLISTPLLTPPEPSVLAVADNRLSRWQLVQKMTETFWKAWGNDYLHTLHQRVKWKSAQNLAKVGQLVLLRNQNLPPCRWELGRILACHPGEDGLVRVVTVRTSQTEYKRPITKLCFLPIAINAETEATQNRN